MENLTRNTKGVTCSTGETVKIKVVPTEVYSRVVGYFRPVQNWNKGKVEEFGERSLIDPVVKI